MSVKIRLSRIGKKNVPFFRIIAVDSRKKRDGAYLDTIGTYDARTSSIVGFDEETYKAWIGKGAQVSDSAKKVYKIYKKSAKGTEATESLPKKAKITRKKKETKKIETAAQADDAKHEVKE